jgi:hypothetical protein
MSTFVTWPKATKYHSVSVRQSGGFRFDSQTGHVTPLTPGKVVVTHCGRDVPETHTAVRTLQTSGGNLSYCQVCNSNLTS